MDRLCERVLVAGLGGSDKTGVTKEDVSGLRDRIRFGPPLAPIRQVRPRKVFQALETGSEVGPRL